MNALAIGFLFALVSAALTSASPAIDPTAVQAQAEPRAAPEDSALAEVRELLEAARRAQADKDYAGARERIVEAIERAFAQIGEREDGDSTILFEELGQFAHDAGELRAAERARRAVLEVHRRTLPQDHRDLQAARGNLALTIKAQGDLQGARVLEEAVLEVFTRTLPEGHRDLQVAGQNLAGTLYALGDLPAARGLFETVLEVFARSLPADHPDLQVVRLNLATTIKAQGDLHGARSLDEAVLEVFARTLPADHPNLQVARLNLATTTYTLGDLHGARALFGAVLEAFSHTLPDDHPNLQKARQGLAATMRELGDHAGARALEEAVLAVRTRTLPEDHRDVQAARLNLATTIKAQGDLHDARALEEAVLEVYTRTLPDDHQDLQVARGNLAATTYKLGDLHGARALEEAVLEVFSHTLPDDHLDLQVARGNLATTIKAQGDLHDARALEEAVLAVRTRTLADDHPDLQVARRSLAVTIVLQSARARGVREGEGEKEDEREGGRERCAELVGALCRSQVDAACAALLTSSVREAEECCAGLAKSLDTTLSFAEGCGVFERFEDLARESFVLSETTRGAALASAAIARRAEGAPDYDRLRTELRVASEALSALAQKGATREEYHRARTRREEAERELMTLARELLAGDAAGLEFDLDALGTCLGERDAVVGFRHYTRWSIAADASSGIAGEEAMGANDAIETKSMQSLCAFIVRHGGAEPTGAASGSSLEIVPLGAFDAIEQAVRGWREAIGAGIERVAAVNDDATNELRGVGVSGAAASEASARGEELRRLLWDPLLPFLGDAERVIVALDDVLHLVPVEALPLGAAEPETGGKRLVGDRWRIETRITLSELLGERSPSDEGGVLVAFGGASFNSEPVELAEADLTALEEVGSNPYEVASLLRGGAWERGFSPLSYTGLEARGIAALHDEVFAAENAAIVLEKRKASRAGLEKLAPRARFLHVATHGWFAPESIAAWGDVEPLDAKRGLGLRLSGEQAVRGMSPMLLCGLALAGANLPEDALGRVPGLVTAEELSTLDLSHCELAVLSACDTNVGERRAGQGVASLQKALQMAGARSVITSLWKVPDEATRELMLDFYRRIWVEKKPKAQALWEAKQKLRAARDERGEPRYTTRDWAAWVLTGEPL